MATQTEPAEAPAETAVVPFPKALKLYPRLRQSVLSVFDACALGASWTAEFEDHQWSSHPAARGQIVHRTIARCLRLLVENEPDAREGIVPVEVAIAEFDDVIRQADIPMSSPDEDSVSPIPLHQIAEARVSIITWSMGTKWDVPEIVGIERRLMATVRYPDGQHGYVERTLTGRIDTLLINRAGWHATVVDYKDTWGIPTEPDEDEEEESDDEKISEEGYFQQRFYALLVFLNFPGIQRVTLRESYVRFATSENTKPTRETSLDRQVLPELEAEFAALAERFDRSVETGVYKPAPGAHCWNCIQPEKCPILPAARREGRVTSGAEADKVVRWIAVTEAALKRYRQALRPWTNRFGPVRIPDAKRRRLWGPVERTRVERPSEEIMAWAVANQIDPTTLYKHRTAVHFEAHSEGSAMLHVSEVAETERMLVAAKRRSDAARKGHRTRRKRRKNGGNGG